MRHHTPDFKNIVMFGDNGIHLKPEKTYDMRIVVVALFICLAVLAGVIFKSIKEQYAALTAPAEYGWVYDTQMTVSLRPAEMHSLWTIKPSNRIKIELAASKPVEVGESPIRQYSSQAEMIQASVPGCGSYSTLMDNFECQATAETQNLYVLDTRNMVDASNAAMGRLLGNPNAGAELLDNNAVTVRLYHWSCTSHCDNQGVQ